MVIKLISVHDDKQSHLLILETQILFPLWKDGELWGM